MQRFSDDVEKVEKIAEQQAILFANTNSYEVYEDLKSYFGAVYPSTKGEFTLEMKKIADQIKRKFGQPADSTHPFILCNDLPPQSFHSFSDKKPLDTYLTSELFDIIEGTKEKNMEMLLVFFTSSRLKTRTQTGSVQRYTKELLVA
jgi:hypothetical protein